MRITLSFLVICLISVIGTGCSDDLGSTKIETSPTEGEQDEGTRRYHFPLQFLMELANPPTEPDSTPPDPFASVAPDPLKARTAEPLPDLGVFFQIPDGAKLAYDRKSETLTAQGEMDFFQSVEATMDQTGGNERQIRILIEAIDTPTKDFSDWLFSNRLSGNGDPLREVVGEWITAGSAKRVETIGGVARSGQRASFEGTRLKHLASSFNPARSPNSVKLEEGSESPIQPVHPTAWSEWKVGAKVTVDPVIGSDMRTIDLNIAPEFVDFVGTRVAPIDQSLTTLYFQSITTQVVAIDGHYTLLGSTHPREMRDRCVLWFVKADITTTPSWRRLSINEVR